MSDEELKNQILEKKDKIIAIINNAFDNGCIEIKSNFSEEISLKDVPKCKFDLSITFYSINLEAKNYPTINDKK